MATAVVFDVVTGCGGFMAGAYSLICKKKKRCPAFTNKHALHTPDFVALASYDTRHPYGWENIQAAWARTYAPTVVISISSVR